MARGMGKWGVLSCKVSKSCERLQGGPRHGVTVGESLNEKIKTIEEICEFIKWEVVF